MTKAKGLKRAKRNRATTTQKRQRGKGGKEGRRQRRKRQRCIETKAKRQMNQAQQWQSNIREPMQHQLLHLLKCYKKESEPTQSTRLTTRRHSERGQRSTLEGTTTPLQP